MWRGGCIIKVHTFSYCMVLKRDSCASWPSSPFSLEISLLPTPRQRTWNLYSLMTSSTRVCSIFGHLSGTYSHVFYRFQLSTRHSPVGGASLPRLSFGAFPLPRSARPWPSSTATGARLSLPTSSRVSATTSVPTRSVCSPARRMRSSRPARISVRLFLLLSAGYRTISHQSTRHLDVNWTGRGGNVAASTYSA